MGIQDTDCRVEALKAVIREIPDFPKPGILFYDITTLLRNGEAFSQTIAAITRRYSGESIDAVAGIEARGFIFAAAVAHQLGVGFIPIRKKGKLPFRTVSQSYSLEYGTDTVEMHEDAVKPGQRILLVDDLIATGGTARAVADMITQCGGVLAEAAFVVELTFLPGRKTMGNYPVFSLLRYDC